jgi:hypothetical protein
MSEALNEQSLRLRVEELESEAAELRDANAALLKRAALSDTRKARERQKRRAAVRRNVILRKHYKKYYRKKPNNPDYNYAVIVRKAIVAAAGDAGFSEKNIVWWGGFLHGLYLYDYITGKEKVELYSYVETRAA